MDRHVTVHLSIECLVKGGADKHSIGEAVHDRLRFTGAYMTDKTLVMPVDVHVREVSETHEARVRTPVEVVA